MITATQPHYYIAPDSIGIQLDVHSTSSVWGHYFKVSLRENASVLVYYPGVPALGYRSDGAYLSLFLKGAGNRYLKYLSTRTYYLYLCIPKDYAEREDDERNSAFLAFRTEQIPITEAEAVESITEEVRELMETHYYILIGTFHNDDTFDLDTGALGTDATTNAWQDKLAEVPTRIEVEYQMPAENGNMLDNSETPHVEWGGSLRITAKLIAEWATNVTDQVDHWGIVRKSDNITEDEAWNAGGEGTPVEVFGGTGAATLLFNATQNDLGTVGAKTEFTMRAYGVDEDDETQYVVLAERTVLVTHTDLQTWVVDYDAPLAAINVDSVGNVKGGLWTGDPQDKQWRLSSVITVRRGSGQSGASAQQGDTHYLTPVATNVAPGPGQFNITPGIGGDVTLLVVNNTIYVTAIAHLRDGEAGDEWSDSDYDDMREMRYADAVFRVNCEGLASIEKKFRIAINHDDAPYITMEMAPATVEVIFDEQYRSNAYSAANSSFEGLPTVSLNAKWRGNKDTEEVVAINALALTLDGVPFSQVQGATYTPIIHTDTGADDPLHDAIEGFIITALPKPAQAQTLLATRTIGVALTAKYAGVDYERTLLLPVQERYKQVAVADHVRHFLLTAVDDWSSYPGNVPPKTNGAYGAWTTDASQAKVSEQQPYLWVYDDTNYSNGKVDSTTPQLMGNWAEDAVTYYINVSLPVLTTDADGTLKAGQSTITVTPYVRRGTGLPQRINTAGFQLVQTLYNPDGTQRAGTAQQPNPDARSSVDGSDFYATWNTIDALGHITYELKDSSGNLLCPVASVPYIADGADVWAADLSNEMDSIHTTDGGVPTAAQSITTVAKLYEGRTEKTFTLIAVKRNGTAMTASAFAWEDTGLTVSISDGTITIAYTTEATIAGSRDVFTFTLQNGTTTRDKSLTVNAVKGDIYNILPSTAQIKAGRTAAGGYTPSTFTLTCGYTRKSIDGSTTSVTDVTSAFGGYNLYYRKRKRSTQSWSIYYRYYSYKASATASITLTGFSLATYDAVEFIICNSNEATITASALSGYQVIDIETVPVVADGMAGDSAVRYYLVINPESLALAAGGDRFNDGTPAKDVDVSVYKQVGYQTPALATVGEFRVSFTVTTVNGQSATYQQTQNHFVIEAIPVSIARIGFVLTDSAGSVEYDARTMNVQAAGRRGYQGPTPRRREWVTPTGTASIAYQSGAEGEAYKDFIVIKDANGVVHQYRCIQSYTVTAANADDTCPLLPTGSAGPHASDYWSASTDDFDFVTTNILLSQYILAESGAFDGLHVNFLHILRNSYIGGFTFNEPYTLLSSDIKTCVNPYNYGATDYQLWDNKPSDAPIASHARIYKSGNILFPDCGSSIVINNYSVARDDGRNYGVNSLNGIPGRTDQRYLYLNLPFYAPFTLQKQYGQTGTDEGYQIYNMAGVSTKLRASGSPFVEYITPGNTNYDANTERLMNQIRDSKSICYEYLGARVTVRNEVADGTEIVIYGVKGVRESTQFQPSVLSPLSGKVKVFEDLDPWGRTSFFWRIDKYNSQHTSLELLPYVSEAAVKNTINANRFMADPNNDSDFYYVNPSIFRPAWHGFVQNVPIVGQTLNVDMATYFDTSFDMTQDDLCNLRAALFSEVYDGSAYIDPLSYVGMEVLSAFELLPGEFCTLEMTYEEGEYFWQIINYGPIP